MPRSDHGAASEPTNSEAAKRNVPGDGVPYATVPDDAPLNSAERGDFERLEDIIRRGIQTFVEVGNALAEACERHLYRDQFGSHAATLRERHHARALRAAAKALSEIADAIDGGAQ
ncbi:hypothetical protein ACFWY6_19865 [Streptomyces sp. NPDC059037]|uniref:hypothetical protein n=1 Tax=Streptomyces sp. NPDC059037 TaxID=3346710 RepID=UPI0036836492